MIDKKGPMVTGGKVSGLMEELRAAGIAVRSDEAPAGPAELLVVPPPSWGEAARIAAVCGLRWSAAWGEHRPPEVLVTSLFFGGDGHLLLRTSVAEKNGELTSQAHHYPAACRPERYIQDMFGVTFNDQPDGRRWICHQAWWQLSLIHISEPTRPY